jgi:hypothetical protein
MYPGASSYFTFTAPENGETTIKLSFEESTFFGIALYSFQFGEYVEVSVM